MLDHITPVLLTHNEEQNIGRTLSRLGWAKDIVVVDSGSTDRTLSILADCLNLGVFKRRFDTNANQRRYAVEETQIAIDWILRLDADFQVSDALVSELAQLDPNARGNAYRIGFNYAIFSEKLFSSLYPANTILLRKDTFSAWDRGDTEGGMWTQPLQRSADGSFMTIGSRPGDGSSDRCATCNASWSGFAWARPDWFAGCGKDQPLMPIVSFIYCLFGKGLIFSGRAGIFYALQRMVAEAILSLMVLEAKLRDRSAPRKSKYQLTALRFDRTASVARGLGNAYH
jgi:glycosyltransferase involved in cell wall biosynthesis